MLVALTGTPGTGKTAAAEILKERGYDVVSVETLARQNDCALETPDGLEVDTDKLSEIIKDDADKKTIIDGHLAHMLSNNSCIVLRCRPDVLKSRLNEREYAEEKIRENLEAEAVDLILVEAMESCKAVFEIDASKLSVEEVADAIESIIKGSGDCYLPGKIDWSQVVLDWY